MDFIRRWVVSRDLKRAGALEGEGYYEQAMKVLEEALEFTADAERPAALRRLGHCALRLGKLARARQVLEEAVKLAPADPDAWFLLANTRFELRDTFGADDAYLEALKLAPDRIDILHAQAEHYAIKLPRAGFEAARRVIRLMIENPEEPERLRFPRELPLVFLRNLALEQRLVDEALVVLDELAARTDWIRPVALNHKGIILANSGRYDEAVRAYLSALTADPEFDAAQFNLGMAYTRQRDFDAARASFSVFARKHPTGAVTTYGLGFLAETKPDVPEMTRLYAFFLERMKTNPPSAPSLGRLDIARGWMEHAKTVLEQSKRHLEEGHEARGPREVTGEE